MRFLLTIIIILLSVSIARSADFHVATTGNDSTGDGSSGSPWKTPEFGAKQLTAGDTLLIHAGTYVLSASNLPAADNTVARDRAAVSPPYNVDGTATDPFTIKSAGDGTVLLDAGTSPEYPAVGTNYGDYVVIDGVSVRGAVILMWSDHSTVKNSDLYGGIDCPESNGGDNFGCVVRVEGGTGCLVQNNKLHDNQTGITQLNSPLVMEYDSTDLVIENNDIYNGVGIGVFLKDNPENVTVRKNHIYDNVLAGVMSSNQDTGHNIYIYQNIFRNNNTSNATEYAGDVDFLIEVAGWYIYNNTFYGSNYANILGQNDSSTISGINVWNNIFSSSTNSFYRLNYSAAFSAQWDYSDYNCFYGSADWREASTWTSLSTYQSGNSESFDANSISTNPNFIDAGGTDPEDYKRSSYPTDGRGGSYESVMGAYITGSERIGYECVGAASFPNIGSGASTVVLSGNSSAILR